MDCEHKRIFGVSAKCSDSCSFSYKGTFGVGYAPRGVNICGGDYIELDFCLDCGKIVGNFPVPEETVEAIFKL